MLKRFALVAAFALAACSQQAENGKIDEARLLAPKAIPTTGSLMAAPMRSSATAR